MPIPTDDALPHSDSKARMATAFATTGLSQWYGARYARGSAIGARTGR